MLNYIDFARNVLHTEAEAILALTNIIDENFFNIASAIVKVPGKIITTGMGKSGNIAKKIASTFASTGTPAFFIHPADASHGDLGMIQSTDIIMGFSVSGNTLEMSSILLYSRSNKIPVISCTCNPDGALYKSSTYNILMPRFKEADFNNLAPSTTSTAMLAIGDTLALTVSKIKEFKAGDFKKIHPGGALGSSYA